MAETCNSMTVVLKPYRIKAGPVTGDFYAADCQQVFAQLHPHSVDVIVTSPPYNLGIQYNRYQDTLSRDAYLEWTSAWVRAAKRVLHPKGSLFLNVGAKPSDPWTALDVAQAVREHLRLQNIVHWIKSIAIDQKSAGAAAGLTRDLAVGHYKPINSDRFLNDCHEFVFHFTPKGASWLNMVEAWFSILTRKSVRRGSFDTVRALIRHIERYLAEWNAHPTPFVWTKEPADIIKKALRRSR